MKKTFTENLLKWNELQNKRIMPWKGEKDPYKIWLSEIILQQTRVEQGLIYYKKFLENFPTIFDLAKAKDENVFKLWEGLGYYSRCKNLLITARSVVDDFNGRFPESFDEILKLKGIGNYTASAIASFAFQLPYAVVDGNVLRVLSRYFGKKISIDSSEGKLYFNQLALQLLYKPAAGVYNQAIMDFGATVCKPQLPDCANCAMNEKCVAFKRNWVNKLPQKNKKLQKRNRWFYYFIFSCNDHYLVNQRTGKDIWQNLYEFYLYETEAEEVWNVKTIKSWLAGTHSIYNYKLKEVSPVYSQKLTHQNLKGQIITIELTEIPASLAHLQKARKEEIHSFAFPKFINQHLKPMLAGSNYSG